jgi:hypothetical protein
MRVFPIAAALISAFPLSAVAAAQAPSAGSASPTVRSGERIYSADGAVVGRVEYVDKGKDGTAQDVAVIYGMRIVHIPADSLSTGPNGVTTSLNRSDLGKLN